MMDMRCVALVGRPNVGKSHLFNRLVGRRMAVVHDSPGVTRDSITAEVNKEGFIVMDTGGMGWSDAKTPREWIAATEQQIRLALQTASLLLFVVDGQAGCTPLDIRAVETLRDHNKPVVLVINKIDHPEHIDALDDFSRLGLGTPVFVSAVHGIGIEQLLQRIKAVLGPRPDDVPQGEKRIKMSLVGRPNVGKSSLGNRLVGKQLLIVSEVPGTTRDAVELELDSALEATDEKRRFCLVDTAGLRYRSKIKDTVMFFSSVRTHRAIATSDVVFLVLDALQGVTQYDKALAGEILAGGTTLGILVNKWDVAYEALARSSLEGYRDAADFQRHFTKAVRKALFFLPLSPIHYTSAFTGQGVGTILKLAATLYEHQLKRLPTSQLNHVLADRIGHQLPRVQQGKGFKLYYAVQTAHHPYTIRIFCNRSIRLEAGYQRYLQTALINRFGLEGCPIRFELVGKEGVG